MAGMIAGWVSNPIDANRLTRPFGLRGRGGRRGRFKRSLAGGSLAMEVALRHFAGHAFAPTTIAALSGSVISRLHFGDVTELVLPRAACF